MADVDPLVIAGVGVGTILLYSAVTNTNPLDQIRSVLRGGSEIRPLQSVAASTLGGGFTGAATASSAAVGSGWESIAALVPFAKVGSTTGGRHAPNSRHYRGKAVDFPGSPGATSPDPELNRVMATLTPHAQSGALAELYYRNVAWRGGKQVSPVSGHDGHVHASVP